MEEQVAPPLRGEIAVVRRHLEAAVGPTVSRARAARLLGVTQTALDRWIARGDVATVPSVGRARGVPLSQLLRLMKEVEAARGVRARPLSAVLRERRRRAHAGIDLDRLLPELADGTPRGHRLAELRSLGLHRLVAERLDADRVEEARERVRRWRDSGEVHQRYADAWERVLELALAEVAARIGADTEEMRALRQASPFAGALTEAERRLLHQQIAERVAA